MTTRCHHFTTNLVLHKQQLSMIIDWRSEERFFFFLVVSDQLQKYHFPISLNFTFPTSGNRCGWNGLLHDSVRHLRRVRGREVHHAGRDPHRVPLRNRRTPSRPRSLLLQRFFLAAAGKGSFVSPAWPDAGIKSGPIFTKVAQKCSKSSFYIKREIFKIAQKVAHYLGYFCNRICLQDFSKVAQSGYTVCYMG